MKAEKKVKLYMTKKEYRELQDAYSTLRNIEYCLNSPVFGDAMSTILNIMSSENGYKIQFKSPHFIIDGSEGELRQIEKFLAEEIGVPYVRCSYDSYCSHIAKHNEELEHRIKNGILKPNEYVINYEIYETEKDYRENKGGYDGEVYELIYSIDLYFFTFKTETIILKSCFHMVWE